MHTHILYMHEQRKERNAGPNMSTHAFTQQSGVTSKAWKLRPTLYPSDTAILHTHSLEGL